MPRFQGQSHATVAAAQLAAERRDGFGTVQAGAREAATQRYASEPARGRGRPTSSPPN
jgi:hypothetical protein